MSDLRYRAERRAEDWVIVDTTTRMAADNRVYRSKGEAQRDAVSRNTNARMRARRQRIAALEDVLQRLVDGEIGDCDYTADGDYCVQHDYEAPCPVGETRRLLEKVTP